MNFIEARLHAICALPPKHRISILSSSIQDSQIHICPAKRIYLTPGSQRQAGEEKKKGGGSNASDN